MFRAMPAPSLWDRLRRARIVQVLLVYLGASWGVLQIADVLADALSLPDWVLPVAVLLLLVGLVIILATAWVQSLPGTTAKEEAGEIPTDWQVAPADALDSLRAGKVPHLTWGRAILGGVVALSLLFGGAGAYVLVTGKSAPGFGPREVGADTAADGIAVVPFEVRGQGLEIWGEGMVDLLSNNLNGVGGYRTVHPRAVMARWKERVGDGDAADLDTALRAAAATGARYALVGSVVGLGDNVRLVSNVYDLDTRKEVAQGQAEGPVSDVLRLVDDLAVGTVRSLLRNTGRQGAGDLRAETLTTESLVALREFLDGERHFRRGDFAAAVQSFERAVAADTAFAIGLVRLSEAYGWLESQGSAKMVEYGSRAVAHADRLPPRYQFIMEGWDALNRQSAEGLPSLKQAVQKYPDDPEAWFLLAETYIHLPSATFATLDDIRHALNRAVTLDPDFAPYWVHVADMAVAAGDRGAAEAALARYVALAGSDQGVEHVTVAIPLLLGDSLEALRALADARTAPPGTLNFLVGTYATVTDRFDRMDQARALQAEITGQNQDGPGVLSLIAQGALTEAARVVTTRALSPGDMGIALGHHWEQWRVLPEGEWAKGWAPSLCAEPFAPICYAMLAAPLADHQRWSELDAAVARLRRAADESVAAGNTEVAGNRRAFADVMEGIGAFKRGDVPRARRLLTPHVARGGWAGGRAQLAMAELELSQGRWDDAIRYAQGQVFTFGRARGFAIQARAWEGKGDPERAREAWRRVVELTRRGDGGVPGVREAREALARLGG